MVANAFSHPRFELVRELGRGGMGVVYEAIDRERASRVALKTMHEAEPGALLRFKREFRSIADLDHDNLLPLYELVLDDGACFFTMELLEGAVDLVRFLRADAPPSRVRSAVTTLAGPRAAASARRLEVRPDADSSATIDPAPVRAAFAQLVEGVDRIHRAGKLHRDLKPSNVLVRPDGRVFVLDFGLVAELDGALPERAHATGGAVGGEAQGRYETRSGNISGTAHYMAPEQARAESLGPACDWYAVGVMLFEALTGVLPFDGDAFQILVAKTEHDAPRVRDLVPTAPADLDRLCALLLSRDPRARPGAAELRATLGAPLAVSVAPAFLGRQDVLARLRDARDRARSGAAVLARVRGPSGMGKSALIERFLESELAGAWVLRGRCFEQETVPWKSLDAIVDALASRLERLDDDERAALPLEGLDALCRMFPVLASIVPPASGGTDADALRARAADALTAVLAFLARRRPIVVVLDDAQWGDEGGVGLLARALAHAPSILVVVGSRLEYEERSDALRRLGQIERELPPRGSLRVDLAPLDAVDAASLVRATAPELSAERVGWVVAEAHGNPFFLQELARYAGSLAPDVAPASMGMDELVRRRVASLSEAGRALVEACAVVARPVPARVVLACGGLTTISPADALALRRAGILRGTGTGLDDSIETYHDRVREAVVRGLARERRMDLHRTAARVLALRPEIEPEALAAHHEAGGEPAEAYPCWCRARDAAASALSPERAEVFARRALASAPDDASRLAAQESLVHLLTNRGRFADAYAEGRAALASLGVSVPAAFSPPALLASLARVALRLRGRGVDALRDLPEAHDVRAVAAIRMLAAVMKAAFQVRPELCITLANVSVDLCLQHGNSRECAIGWMAHGAIFRGGIVGQHRVGHDYGRLSLDLVERFDCDAQRAEVRFVVGYFATAWMAPYEHAEALFERAFEAAERIGDEFHAGCAVAGLAMSLTIRGAPPDDVLALAGRFRAFLLTRRLSEPLATLEAAAALAEQRRGGPVAPPPASDTELAAYGSRHFAHFQLLAAVEALEHRGETVAARAMLARAERLVGESAGMLQSAQHEFLVALLGARPRRALAARRLTTWAAACPQNFAAKAAIARASAGVGILPRRRVLAELGEAIRLAEETGRPGVVEIARRAGRRMGVEP